MLLLGLLVSATLAVSSSAQAVANNATVNWTFTLPSAQVVMNPMMTPDNTVALVPTNTTLFAFESGTGVLMWAFAVPTGDTGGYVAADADTVYLGTQLSVFALSRSQGEIQWTLPLPIPSDAPDRSRHARVDTFEDGSELLYVTTWNTPLLAVDRRSGILRWSGPSSFIAKEHVHVIGDFAHFQGVAADGTGHLVCVAARTGVQQWSLSHVKNFEVGTRLGEPVFVVRYSHPVTQSIAVFNGTTGAIAPGVPLWNKTFEGIPATFDYVHYDGVVYTATSPLNDAYPNYLTASSIVDARTLWTATIGFFYLLAGSGAVFAFGTVTHTKAYNAATGALLWEYPGIGVNDGVAQGGLVIFGTATQVVAINVNASG